MSLSAAATAIAQSLRIPRTNAVRCCAPPLVSVESSYSASMEARRRFPKSAAARPAKTVASSASGRIQASDALPLPIRHTNLLFSALFAASLIFLMWWWREKIRSSMPLHVVGLAEIFSFVGLITSLIYLLSFFGIAFIQSIISCHDEEDDFLLSPTPPTAAAAAPPAVLPTPAPSSAMPRSPLTKCRPSPRRTRTSSPP